jgi:hypothetical protein
MKRFLPVSLSVLLLLPVSVLAQADTAFTYKNSLKVNLLGMTFNNFSLLYERSLNEHWTVLAASSYRWGGDIPKTFALGNIIVNSESRGIRGFSFTPELRYYYNFCQCEGSPSGLYTGLYGRLTKYFGDLDINVWTGEEYLDVATAGNFREFGLGLQLGYQFIIKGRFLVDLMFAGPRLGTNKIKFSIESDYAEEVIPIVEEEINEKLEWLGMDPISIEPSAEANFELDFGFRYFRYAVGFGILFSQEKVC